MKNIPDPDSQKLYLVTFEFFINNRRKKFKKGFYATSEEHLKGDIHKYLEDYYGLINSPEVKGKFYYYGDKDLSVNLINWEEITSYEQIGF